MSQTRRNVRSRPRNIDNGNYNLSRTFVRVTGDVRRNGFGTPDGRYGEMSNLTGYFAKSHRMRPEQPFLELP